MFRHALACAALLAGCVAPLDSDWMLIDRGYAIDVAPYGDEFSIRVHVNQLRQIGGDPHSAQFHLWVGERVRWHGICLGDWQEQLCADPAACVQRTRSAVRVHGRCVSKSAPQAPA